MGLLKRLFAEVWRGWRAATRNREEVSPPREGRARKGSGVLTWVCLGPRTRAVPLAALLFVP